MIVDPDFVDHWKTRTLVALLDDDEAAPVYVIRLWAHCQNRRTWIFDIPAAALKAICRFSGDATKFEQSLIECGFIARDEEQITVVGWDEYNASLIAAWSNGGKGGRPRKQKIQDASETHGLTHGKPTGNPPVTHGVTDKSREDKKREEQDSGNARAVIDYLNEKTGKNFQHVKANLSLVQARLKDGASVDQIRAVVDAKVMAWLDDSKMSEYLRPDTLFNATKFAQYVGALPKGSMGDGWWKQAGFEKEWQAVNAGCTAVNAHQWRDGERIGEKA